MFGVGEGARASGRTRWVALWAGASACLALACDDDCNRPPIFVPALNVEVVDATTREPICDATVMLERGGVALQALPGACRFSSDTDRPGSFHVSVEHPDYQLAEKDVVVAGDDCGYAEQRDIEVELAAQ